MAGDSGTILLKQIDTLFRAGTSAGSTDGELLARFLLRRDELAEAAFTALVERHGAMVLRVCRQVLGDQHDAEDAAQAVFLVLARRAGSIAHRESVASWLHGVALRVAARARRAAARRRAHESRAGEIMGNRREDPGPTIDGGCDSDRWALLHQEIDRLPAHFRAPLVLLHLEGLTQEQAAAHLRLPLGTLQSRSARGRARLKARLEKRGAALSAGLLDAESVRPLASPAPPAWADATVKLAVPFSHGKAGTVAAAGAVATKLAREVLRAGFLAKVKVAIALGFLMAAAITGAAAWTRRHENPESLIAVKKVELPAEGVDPAALLNFSAAAAGPITGVPPQSVNGK
jgi:polysaccharide biosynthesis/export protein